MHTYINLGFLIPIFLKSKESMILTKGFSDFLKPFLITEKSTPKYRQKIIIQ